MPDGQPATTRFRVLARQSGVALALVEPLTGRTHRFAFTWPPSAFHSIGDALYGGGSALEALEALEALAGEPHAGRGGPAGEPAPGGPLAATSAVADWNAVCVARRMMLHAMAGGLPLSDDGRAVHGDGAAAGRSGRCRDGARPGTGIRRIARVRVGDTRRDAMQLTSLDQITNRTGTSTCSRTTTTRRSRAAAPSRCNMRRGSVCSS